jgi:hypothetical protein
LHLLPSHVPVRKRPVKPTIWWGRWETRWISAISPAPLPLSFSWMIQCIFLSFSLTINRLMWVVKLFPEARLSSDFRTTIIRRSEETTANSCNYFVSNRSDVFCPRGGSFPQNAIAFPRLESGFGFILPVWSIPLNQCSFRS